MPSVESETRTLKAGVGADLSRLRMAVRMDMTQMTLKVVVVHVSDPGTTGQPAVIGESLGSTGTSRKGRHVPKIHQDPQDDVEEEVETSRSSSVERYDEGHST